jgi:hypothetical protein
MQYTQNIRISPVSYATLAKKTSVDAVIQQNAEKNSVKCTKTTHKHSKTKELDETTKLLVAISERSE